MPDTTPQATQPAEAPPLEDGWRPHLAAPPDLSALRARLDELDDQIHDLLMERARVVENVARSGKTAAFRPGREASILRRLLARHTGKLPSRTLVRMWREMLAGTTAMQTSITIASVGADSMPALAREHFGFLTPVIGFASAAAALDAVRAGTATVAVLPFPTGESAWWPLLVNAAPRLHIIARLPYWSRRPDHVPAGDALVVGTAAPDESGDDRCFLALPLGADRALLADSGLTVLAMHGSVAEVAGLLTETSPGMPAGTIALGGYAVPVAGEAS